MQCINGVSTTPEEGEQNLSAQLSNSNTVGLNVVKMRTKRFVIKWTIPVKYAKIFSLHRIYPKLKYGSLFHTALVVYRNNQRQRSTKQNTEN